MDAKNKSAVIVFAALIAIGGLGHTMARNIEEREVARIEQTRTEKIKAEQIEAEKAKAEQKRLEIQAESEQKETKEKAEALSVVKEVTAFQAELRSILNTGASGEQIPYIKEKARRLERKAAALCLKGYTGHCRLSADLTELTTSLEQIK